MAGLEKPTSGEIWINGRDVTGVSVQKRNVSMVHQQFINYPNFTVLREHRLPASGRRHGSQGNQIAAVGEVAELLKLTPMLDRQAGRTVGRTAAAHRPGARAGQGIRSCSARRTACQSRLTSCARNCATNCRSCSRIAAAPSSMRPPNPMEALLLGGSYRRRCTRDASHNFGETAQVYRNPQRSDVSAKVFSDPPINTVPVTKQGAISSSWAAISVGRPTGAHRRPGGRHLHDRPSGRITCCPTRAAAGRGEGHRDRPAVTELSGSESIAHFDLGGQTWVSQAHGVHAFEIGAQREFHVEIERCLYFGEQNQLIAA